MVYDREVCSVFERMLDKFSRNGFAALPAVTTALDELSHINGEDGDAVETILQGIATAAPVQQAYGAISRSFTAMADCMLIAAEQPGEDRTARQADAFMLLVFAMLSAPREADGRMAPACAAPAFAGVDRLLLSNPAPDIQADIVRSRAALEQMGPGARQYVVNPAGHASFQRMAAAVGVYSHHGLQ